MTTKPPATATHRQLREKLAGLCNSPIAGEAAAAQHKLERLLARYDFDGTGPQEAREGDLFTPLNSRVRKGKARQLFTFEVADSDIASFTRWAMEKQYSMVATIRNGLNWESSIWVEAHADAMPQLKVIAATIRTQFATLWRTLRENANVDQADRKPFMQGLYDGMMDDPRQPGQLLPQRTIPKKKRKGVKGAKSKATSVATKPGLATHPYTLAVELGRQIRLRASIDETTTALQNAIAGVIGAPAE